jgi:Tfp pilus assembly protein PilO
MFEAVQRLTRQLRPETLIGIAGTVVVVTAMAGHFWLLKPAIDRYGELDQERVLTALQLDQERGKVEPAAMATISTEVDELRSQVIGGHANVPLPQMESFVIDALDRVSVRHDVKLESVTPGTVTQVVMFTELPYQVQVTGNYFSLFEWFRDVENELRPMVVKNFEMEKGRGSERIEMSLQIVAYRAEDET